MQEVAKWHGSVTVDALILANRLGSFKLSLGVVLHDVLVCPTQHGPVSTH